MLANGEGVGGANSGFMQKMLSEKALRLWFLKNKSYVVGESSVVDPDPLGSERPSSGLGTGSKKNGKRVQTSGWIQIRIRTKNRSDRQHVHTHDSLFFMHKFYRGLSVWLVIFSGFLSKKKVWNALWNMTYVIFWRRRECAVGWSSVADPDPLGSDRLSYGSGTGSESESRSEPLVGSGSEQKSCSDPQHIQTQDSRFFDRRLSVWLFIFAEFF